MKPRPAGFAPWLLAVAAGCSGGEQQVDPLRILPAEVDLVVAVNAEAVLGGPIGERLRGTEAEGASPFSVWLRNLENETAVKVGAVRRAALGAQTGPRGLDRLVVVIEGGLGGGRLREWLEEQAAGTSDYRGVEVYSLVRAGPEGQGIEIHAALPGSRLVVFGDPELVAGCIDRYDGIGGAVLGDPGWAERLSRVDPEADAWGVLGGEAVSRAVGSALESLRTRLSLEATVSRLRDLAVEVRVVEEVEVAATLALIDPAAAPAAAGDLRAALHILRTLNGERRPRLREILDSIRVEALSGEVLLQGSIPLDWLEEGGPWAEPLPRTAAAGS